MRALAARSIVFPLVLCLGIGAASPAKKPASSKVGVQTPGIQIAMTELKQEADIELPGPADVLASADGVYAGSGAKGALVRIDPKANKAQPVAGVTKPCGGMVSAFGSVWMPDCQEHTLVRLDPKTSKVAAKIPAAVSTAGAILAATEDSIWLLSDEQSTLLRIDPEENKVVAELRLPKGSTSVVFGEAALWVTCPSIDKLLKLNPRTGLTEKRIEIAGQPSMVALGEGSIWVLSSKEGKVSRVDPKTDKVTATVELNIPGLKGSMVFGEGFLWVSAPGFPITRIDPATDKVAQQFTGGQGTMLVASGGAIWLADPESSTLKRIDVKRIKATLAP